MKDQVRGVIGGIDQQADRKALRLGSKVTSAFSGFLIHSPLLFAGFMNSPGQAPWHPQRVLVPAGQKLIAFENNSYLQTEMSRIRLRAMIVCICNAVNTSQIREAIHRGARDVNDVRDETLLGTCCGQCVEYAESFIAKQVNTGLATDASR